MRHHHVNLAYPPGGLDAESTFLIDTLGYAELPPNAAIVDLGFTPHWFAGADGSQIHLSEDPEHAPAARAHIAIELTDAELGAVRARLTAAGTEHRVSDARPGIPAQIVLRDPAGNRWELRGPE